MLTFNGGDSGESPAGAALFLVLDWGDDTLGGPVDGGGQSLEAKVQVTVDLVSVHLGVHSQTVESAAELKVGHVGEVVDSNGEALGAGEEVSIVSEDKVQVGGKNALAELLLLKVSVRSTESLLEKESGQRVLVTIGTLHSDKGKEGEGVP